MKERKCELYNFYEEFMIFNKLLGETDLLKHHTSNPFHLLSIKLTKSNYETERTKQKQNKKDKFLNLCSKYSFICIGLFPK